ncbi:hypothetical protein ACTA9N_002777 [Vibrio parahaemolyticus]
MDLGSKYQRKLVVGFVLVSPLLVSPSLSAAQLERLEPNHGRVVSLEKQNLAATQNVAKALGLKPGNNVQKLKLMQKQMAREAIKRLVSMSMVRNTTRYLFSSRGALVSWIRLISSKPST